MKLTHVTIRGVVYDLGHLRDFSHTVVIPAKDGKPPVEYHLQVTFSCHCFTVELKGNCPPEEVIDHDGERRQFDADRHELSKLLPDIIRDLHNRKCFHANHNVYVTIDLANGRKYCVYFEVTRKEGTKLMILRVRSAYPDPQNQKGHDKPVQLRIVLYNTFNGLPIRVPK